MRALRTLGPAIVFAGTLAGGVAQADSQPQRFSPSVQAEIGPALPGVLVPIVQCMMGSGDVMADVLIRNNGSSALEPGTDIHWQTNGGASGIANTGFVGLAPGAVLHAGQAHYPFTCGASLPN